MKKYRINIIAIVTLIIATIFTSCERDEYRWENASLDYRTGITIPPTGGIVTDFRVDKSWVKINNGGSRYFSNMRYVGGKIVLTRRGYVNDAILRIAGTDIQTHLLLDFEGANEYTSRDVNRFLNSMIDLIDRYGSVIIEIDTRGASRADLTIELITDIDVFTRY